MNRIKSPTYIYYLHTYLLLDNICSSFNTYFKGISDFGSTAFARGIDLFFPHECLGKNVIIKPTERIPGETELHLSSIILFKYTGCNMSHGNHGVTISGPLKILV
uniref:Uncharacterized protein n=1 Tax=Cacopsylla melanoneura TaxID=428564 RepID=A0A8D9E9D4_9HEMI